MEREDKKAKADQLIEHCMANGDSLGEAMVHADSYLRTEQVDTREKLEADVREFFDGISYGFETAVKWLDRQAAITAREVSDSYEHKAERQSDRIFELHNKLADALERVDSLTAELESYRKVTDQNEREECSPETIDNMLNEIGELEEQVAELTAERDKLNEDCSSLDKCCNALEEELKRVRAERNICRWNLGELENNIGREIAELLDENGVIEVFKEPLGKRRLITETQRQLEKQVEKLTAERDDLAHELRRARKAAKRWHELASGYRDKAAQFVEIIETLTATLDRKNARIKRLRGKLKRARNK